MAFLEIIDEKFFIPQLNTERRVYAILPDQYYKSAERYSVLYLQDGQNLIESGGPFGSWSLVTNLTALEKAGIKVPIIICVDHAGKKRIKEYSPRMPWTKVKVYGFEYLQFLSKVLKPFVDNVYRTKSIREYTGIGGSSMGGLVSIYAASIYPEIYSKFLIFSPSLWLRPSFASNPNLFLKLSQASVYIYGGEKESKTLVSHITKLNEMMIQFKSEEDVQIRLSINPSGHHQEKYWAKEINIAIPWLYQLQKVETDLISNI